VVPWILASTLADTMHKRAKRRTICPQEKPWRKSRYPSNQFRAIKGEKGRGEGFGRGRRVMSVVAKEYGYKGQEIAGYLWRDPSVITRYLKEGSKLTSDVKNVHAILQHVSNKQV
jgi:hypothetical protein